MTSEDRKYVRVYYNDLIRDYPEMWADDQALATWLRMLATADPMWPTPPELPRTVRARILARLTGWGIVEMLPGHRFRLKGIDAERQRRSDAARNAAAVRWHSESNAPAMPKRNEQKQDEQKQADGPPGSTDTDSLDTYYELTLYRPWGDWSGDRIRGAIASHGDQAVSAAMRAVFAEDSTRKTLLSRTEARLARDAERSSRKREADHAAAIEATRITPEQAAENKRLVDAEMARILKPRLVG